MNKFFFIFRRRYLIIKNPDFERRICAQTQDLQIFKECNTSQLNLKEVLHNTAYSVQIPYIAGHSL